MKKYQGSWGWVSVKALLGWRVLKNNCRCQRQSFPTSFRPSRDAKYTELEAVYLFFLFFFFLIICLILCRQQRQNTKNAWNPYDLSLQTVNFVRWTQISMYTASTGSMLQIFLHLPSLSCTRGQLPKDQAGGGAWAHSRPLCRFKILSLRAVHCSEIPARRAKQHETRCLHTKQVLCSHQLVRLTFPRVCWCHGAA